ncbi:MAG: hypothetical protein IT384_34810 [Deltaproteobacteria bacterium]|nr:hypothetical protein [Deltaproteobacteria bacterium]
MSGAEEVKLGKFAASVATCLADLGGELALPDDAFARLFQEASNLERPTEPIAVELLALCHKSVRLLGAKADRACGQILFIIAALSTPEYAVDAAAALVAMGSSRDLRPVAPAASLAHTPLGTYRSFKKDE